MAMRVAKLTLRPRGFLLLSALLIVTSTTLWFYSDKSSHQYKYYPPTYQYLNSNKTILLWTPFFGVPDYIPPLNESQCSQQSCQFTSDRNFYLLADAIIFHFRDVDIHDLPDETIRPDHQRWIMLLHESPENTPKDVVRALDGKINWTITYRQDSDITLGPVLRSLEDGQSSDSYIGHVVGKSRMIAWFVSNCYTASRREAYVDELRKYIPVDIFGRCGSHKCHPAMSPKCYEQAASEYFFYLSFENSLCRDYVTEKLFNVLAYPIVPIVMNSANMSHIAPRNSYISVNDFNTPSDLATYLIAVVKKKFTKYIDYFQWKSQYKLQYNVYSCRLCEMLHDTVTSNQVKVYTNLYDWWFQSANCSSWSPVQS